MSQASNRFNSASTCMSVFERNGPGASSSSQQPPLLPMGLLGALVPFHPAKEANKSTFLCRDPLSRKAHGIFNAFTTIQIRSCAA
eukprot:2197163-Amphidinium_carterae.1